MNKKAHGKLEVICGSMFSGKSEELIRRIRRAKIAKLNVQLFKPSIDNRKEHVHTHNGDLIQAYAVKNTDEISQLIFSDVHVVGIDEIQFFSHDIVLLVDRLVEDGKRVVVAGLDLDFRGIPFGCIPTLLAIADEIIKLKAVCIKSGREARFSQRLVNGKPAKHSDPIVMIGTEECYEARSRDHYEIDKKLLEEYVKKQDEL